MPKARYLTKRNFLGALLFLIFVGEPTVGIQTGLFVSLNIFVLGALYLNLFWLYESLIARYKLTYAQLIPLTFIIYSVLVTGLLHGELTNYAKGQAVITTLIRIQCSVFPIFAYYLLNRYLPRQSSRAPSIKRAGLILLVFILLLTPTKKFGLITLIQTFQKVPLISTLFVLLAVAAILWLIYLGKAKKGSFESKSFTTLSWFLLIIGCIPSVVTLIALIVIMPVGAAIYLRKSAFRQAQA
jgi:hypothetical protein